MCTVTYIPYQKHGFVLTSGRDEKLERLSEAKIVENRVESHVFLYPQEPESNGTWIGCSSGGIVGCLLNGAFKPYDRTPPYRKSRGLILLEILESFGSKKTMVPEFLDNIEPFTIILVKYFNQIRYVQEFRWDGKNIHTLAIDSETPHLWASAALFHPDTIEEKKENFQTFINRKKQVTPEDLFQVHLGDKLSGQDYYPHFSDLKGGIVNMTQVIGNNKQFTMNHVDIQADKRVQKSLQLTG